MEKHYKDLAEQRANTIKAMTKELEAAKRFGALMNKERVFHLEALWKVREELSKRTEMNVSLMGDHKKIVAKELEETTKLMTEYLRKIEDLKKAVELARKRLGPAGYKILLELKELRTTEQALDKAVKVLEWYANKNIYTGTKMDTTPDIQCSGWEFAQEVLAEIKKMRGNN